MQTGGRVRRRDRAPKMPGKRGEVCPLTVAFLTLAFIIVIRELIREP